MKKILYTLLAGVMALSSCSKSDEAPTALQDNTTTFTLSVEEPTVQASAAKAATRTTTTVAPTRYIMEVWSEDGQTAENVFGAEGAKTNRAEILATSGSSFTVVLDKTKAYTCLFWADDNTTFNAASLKNISLNTGKEMTEAYFSKVAVAKGKNPAVAVTLKRAVAKITLTETAGVKTTDDLALAITNIYPTFSVLDAQASGTAAEWSKSFKPAATTGTIGTFYLFAKSDKELSDMTFTYATEAAKTVSNIPLQQNHATNIKGEYSNILIGTFTVTADNEWTTPENEVEFGKKAYKVGDIYPDATAPIGVVFWVDPTDATKGKIMSLDEATSASWSTEDIITNATSDTDGAANTATIFALTSYSPENYPAFAWCAGKNTPTKPAGINWYIPAIDELKDEIYANKAALNTALGRVSGATQLAAYCWSSTEADGSHAWNVNFGNGYPTNHSKGGNLNVRVVSAF